MTAPIDKAYVEILPDLRKFAPQMKAQVAQSMRGLSTTVGTEYQKTTRAVQGETAKMAKATKGVADESRRSISSLGAAAGAVAGLAVGSLVRGFITAATEQQKANAQTAAVIKSTGGAAHVTAAQIGDLSGRLAEQTGIQDDVIQSGANMLLTFTNVRNEVGKGNDVFNQAVSVVTDMSVALGQDTKNSAIQLGKALNDPIKGVTALQRVGVTFTQAQKDQIAVMVQTGDTLGAQKVILQELNKEFGGSAAAQATAAGKMSVAWDNFSEQMGNALLPALTAVFDILSQLMEILGPFAPVLAGVAGAAVALTTAVWLTHKATAAWRLVTGDISKILDVFRPKVVAQTVANEALAESEVAAGAAGKGMLGGMAAFAVQAGPIVAIAAGLTFGLSKLYDATNAFGDSLAGKTLSGIKDLDKVLQTNGGSFDAQAQKVLAATLVQNGYVEKLGKAGISAADLTTAVTGSDEAFKGLIQRWKDGGSPANDTIFSLQRIHDHFRESTVSGQDNAKTQKQVADAARDMNGALGGASAALQEQQKFLNDNNLTVEQATKKYTDAVAQAHTFTAELGYMSTALDTLSNNNITATLGQDQLNAAMGTAADGFAGARAQVAAHSTALAGNTTNAIANRDWALQQIQAINSQALSYAKSSGSIDLGTKSLDTNKEALRTSMLQAGFTRGEVDKLLATYAATPADVRTSISEQGSAAVLSALGDIAFQLHAIADPVWKANLDISAGATAAQGGRPMAKGGRIQGPGGPTDDVIPIWGSAGEYMINAAATAQHLPLLNAINAGKFAAGGLVGALNIAMSPPQVPDIKALYRQAFTSAFGATGGPATVGGSLGAWIAAALAITGTPGSWAAAIQRRIMFESGGNPQAINNWDSNAMAGDPSRGLMQTIGSTFSAYHQAGTSFNIYDPVANIAAAINYIKARYGSIFAIDPPVQGYGNGGTVNRTGLALVHKGEEILPNSTASKLPVVELGPTSIAAIAAFVRAVSALVVEMDGRAVATVVTKHQNAWDIRGSRR